MPDKQLSKILVLALFNAAIDFLGEVKTQRQRLKADVSENHFGAGLDRFDPVGRATGVIQKTGGRFMNNEERSYGFAPGLLVGSLVGGLIGAGLALWYAPQPGKKTQALLRREANRVQKQVNKKANSLVSSAEELASDAAERAGEWAGQGRDFVQGKVQSLKQAVER
jgi:gas vesicle protein